MPLVVCVHVRVCACVFVHTCVCVINGYHDQSSLSEVSQSISSQFAHRFVTTLEDNPQTTKCIHKQFTVKSVGSEWPPGVKESIRNPVIPLTLAWYAVLANIIQIL